MRNIKFRAQQFNHGKHGFQYGSYVTDNKNYHAIIKENPEDSESMLNTLINPETLGQFTGLTDRNGVDKYEGDVLSMVMEDNSIHKVVIRYSDKYEKFVYCPLSESWDFDRDVVSNPYKRAKYEVIGNIHENPELIS